MNLNWNLISDPVLVDAFWIWSDFKNNPNAKMTRNRLAAYNYLTREVFGRSGEFNAEVENIGAALVMTTNEIQALADVQRVIWFDANAASRARLGRWSQNYTEGGKALLENRFRGMAADLHVSLSGELPSIGAADMPSPSALASSYKDKPRTVEDYARKHLKPLEDVLDGAYADAAPSGGKVDWTSTDDLNEADMDIDELDWDPASRLEAIPPVEAP